MANGDAGVTEPRAIRVDETGIALVHEGELILPAPGSEAELEAVAGDARATIVYYFPVEVEVRAAPEAVSAEDIVGQALGTLIDGLGSLV
jgi:hypothetical protein